MRVYAGSDQGLDWRGREGAHGQEDVAVIHEDQNETPDASKVADVAEGDECDGDDVVGHHLHVVLAARLGVEDEDLVQVKSGLGEVIELDGSREGGVWVV